MREYDQVEHGLLLVVKTLKLINLTCGSITWHSYRNWACPIQKIYYYFFDIIVQIVILYNIDFAHMYSAIINSSDSSLILPMYGQNNGGLAGVYNQ